MGHADELMDDDTMRGICGAVGYLQKPLVEEEILDLIETRSAVG